MGMQKIPLEAASDEDIRLFATLVQGLSIKAGANRETLLARLKTAWEQDYIVLNFDHGEQAAMTGAPPQNPNGAGVKEPERKVWTKEEIDKMAGTGLTETGTSVDPRVRLIVSETAGPMGKQPVFLSVNGRGILVPRKKEVSLAYRYLPVLRAAVSDEVEQDFENEMLVSNEVQRFPIRIISEPSAEEIKEWDIMQAAACGQVVAAA